MSPLEKTVYGVFMAAAITFGGLVYQGALSRISNLEAAAAEVAREVKVKAIADAAVSAKIQADALYLRMAVDRIELRLEKALPFRR